MNFKTTLALIILVGAGATVWWLGPAFVPWLWPTQQAPAPADAGTLSTLKNELAADKLTRIEVQHAGGQLILERPSGGAWSLPGGWRTRQQEVEELVRLVTGLASSRFSPLALENPPELKKYGLDQPPVRMIVWVGSKPYRLAFGEEPSESNRFSRATYLRLEDNPEVIRLAPGLVTILERPQDYYQQRRLFPSERVARDADSQEKAERLEAQLITVKGATGSYALTKKGDEWELSEPVHDHVDPDKLKTLLASVPDIWAEQFVGKANKDLAEYGLKEPEQTLRVASKANSEVTLLIGKKARTKTRTVMRPAPSFGGPQMPPQQEVVHEEYRYAKLAGNDQIFEIKADKLKGIFVEGKSLRDAQLARFRTEEARRVEINPGNGASIVLAKEKDHWQLQKPYQGDAEDSKVTELLDKLSGLQTRDKDVLDGADAKAYGLAGTPASVKVTAEEKSKGEAKDSPKKTRTFTFTLGKHDVEKKNVYVRMEGYSRINAVEDSVLPLVQRPVLAYRGRRILDYNSTDLAKIEVQGAREHFALQQTNSAWHLTSPAAADVDSSKVFQLANDIGRLEAVEHVSESATPQALDQTYGLAKPSLSARITFTDSKKPAQRLLIGKQRPGKPEYFAKLESGAGIFAVKKELHDALEQDSLAYLPLQLWQLQSEDIKELHIRKGEPEYRLKRDGTAWKIAGPFDANATTDLVKTLEQELANLRCERYVALAATDLGVYGLDKPYLRVGVQEADRGKDDKPPAKPAVKERTLLIGKPADKLAKTRFAKLEDGKTVFVVGEKILGAVDHAALDFLDLKLLALDRASVERIQSKSATEALTLQRQGNTWRVLDSPAPPFPADSEAMSSLLELWANLRAQRFAAYGAKLDLAAYGLDKPARTVTVTFQPPAANGKPATPAKHNLAIGKSASTAGEHYARLDDAPAVVVLGASVIKELTRGYLDFVDHSALRFDARLVQQLERHMDKATLDVAKGTNGWQITKPVVQHADEQTLDALVAELGSLQAKHVAAYPAGDLKSYGLDSPAATFTLQLKTPDGKPAEHVIKLGKETGDASTGQDRFAIVDNSQAVIVLPGTLARRLMAPPLQFRDHNLATLAATDRIVLQRGPRKAVFARIDDAWKMTEPLEVDAEQTDLEDFAGLLSRLRADELVADKPADLSAYGLDRPEVRWQVFAGEKPALNLLVGVEEKSTHAGSGRRFAKLANDSLVFLCSPQLTGRLLGEYRTRTIWPPLDASQIDRLSFGYADNPFVLEKPENEWRVAGKPQVKVQADAVREALDALAGLKAARYVIDKGADLKLYGLEPPQLVLQIQTRSGGRGLHIGRREGESNRYYARVPEGDNSAVFVIAEVDASRFIRSLPGFVQKGTSSSSPIR